MIVTQERKIIEIVDKPTADFPEEVEFTIYNSPKAFRAIASQIYPNQYKSTILELSANCFDAHVAAGTEDKPFEVTLPSAENPFLKFRDYGISMSHEFMMTKYTRPFYSNKDQSNLFNGEKGLGRLSALGVCDSYKCSCFLNGVRKDYTIYFGENGVPRIAYLHESETTEPNGVYLEIPIKPEDVNKFDEHAKEAFAYFKVKPIIHNRDNFEIKDKKYIIQSDDKSWGLQGSEHNSLALMSVYAYPIQPEYIPDLTNLQRQILNSGVVLNFNLGEIHTTTNREGLEYNNRTINSIKSKLDEITPFIKDTIIQTFYGKTLFEQIELRESLLEYNGNLRSIADLVRVAIRDLNIPTQIHANGFEVYKFTWDTMRERLKKSMSVSFYHERGTMYFFSTKKSYLPLKAKKFFETAENRYKPLIIFYPVSETAVEEFKTRYNIDVTTFTNADTLPFERYTPGDRRVNRVYQYKYQYRSANCWLETEIDREDNIIYVIKKGYYIENFNDTARHFEGEIKILQSLLGREIKVYGLTQRQLKDKPDNWVNFFELLKTEKARYAAEQQEKIAIFNYFTNNYKNFPNSLLENLSLDENTLAYKAYQEFKKIKEELKDFKENLVNLDPNLKTDKYKYNSQIVYQKYPLLKCVQYYKLHDECSDDLANYIKWKDSIIETPVEIVV